MVRPQDLPQPVRNHPAHQLPLDGTGLHSPGPAAYGGYGVTEFDRDHRGGKFNSSRDKAMIPSSRGPMELSQRQISASTPGPIYNPHKVQTRLGSAFPRARRFDDAKLQRESATPGPGAFYDEEHNQSAIDAKHVSSTNGTLPRSKRRSLADPNNNPSAAEYSPNVAPTRIHHGGSSFPHASVKQRNARIVAKCETSDAQIAGHEELETAEKWTRPASAARPISIGRGPRFARDLRPGSADIGPGQYDSVTASSKFARHPPMIGFTMGTRAYKNYLTFQEMDREIAATGGGTSHQILPSTLSKRGVKLSPRRETAATTSGQRSTLNNNSSGSSPNLYNPDISQTRPNRNTGCSFPRANRFGPREPRPATANASVDENINIPSTLDTSHGAKIGTGKRFTMSVEQKECFHHPAPSDYSPKLPKRPESSAKSISNRNEKIGQLLKEAQITPGPKYDIVDLNILREPLSKPLSIGRAKRGLLEKKEDSNTPGVGTYDVPSDPRKKSSRSAILYLGA
jgi:hypothetical protein